MLRSNPSVFRVIYGKGGGLRSSAIRRRPFRQAACRRAKPAAPQLLFYFTGMTESEKTFAVLPDLSRYFTAQPVGKKD